ncbi:DNA polymerase alpha subunit B [Cucumis melo var. makuwa]|uniref:DNA polymerase alpha subunit B n=1 Tax=Cucumis melo var. makuwa TaxID=1194695 RepID=A0A5D3BJQ2_CUCMM|nr:DNA polymerase alpha subunit B [Cucumis melo var. makuwa]
MAEEIGEEFKRSGFTFDEEEEILKRCVTFCVNYNLKPSDIVSSWEVYYLNRLLDGSVVELEQMDGFLQHLQNEQKETVIKGEPDLHVYSSKDVDVSLAHIVVLPVNTSGCFSNFLRAANLYVVMDSCLAILSNQAYYKSLHKERLDLTPYTNGGLFSSGKPSKHETPFGQRTEKFVVRFNINSMPDMVTAEKEDNSENDEDAIIKKVRPLQGCSLTVHGSGFGLEPNCRFMYDKDEDRFNALDNRIMRHAKALAASGLYEEAVDPTVASQRSMFAVGMIYCDGEGHLNDKSILLQSSIAHSGGQRVRLELQNLSQFSIFPGQVVGIEGHNPSGHCLIASKFVDSFPLSATIDPILPPAKKIALNHDVQPINQSSTPSELSMIIASGPYTTTDNLLFEPLTELLAYAKRKVPQLLILLGPFVDSEHSDIKRGTVEMSFEEIFKFEVLRRVQNYAEHMGPDARVLLMPSTRDANHDFVFPQPPFDIPSDLKLQISSPPNPCILEANQAKIACCTMDILRHLSGEELSRNLTKGGTNDRLSTLASHILRQRSFYPLYPPAEGVPLDFSLAPQALDISVIPDILILPSDMKHFVKVISLGEGGSEEEQARCVCVNPGRLAKGEGGGTFVELNYFGRPDQINASVVSI